MRLQQYILNEVNILDIENFTKNVLNDCKPFLKKFIPVYRRIKDFLYRGAEYKDTFGVKTTRKNRYPASTPIFAHKMLDAEFKKKFGWKPRSESVFCTFDVDTAELYGYNVFCIFPIGKYKYLWSPDINDLTVDLYSDFGFKYAISSGLPKEEQKEILKKDEDIIKKVVSTYQTNDLMDAAETTNEIMIKCNKYYYIQYNSYYFQLFKQIFDKRIR